jgi:hypothetical protein
VISPTVIGALVIAVPALFIAYVAFFWRRRPIFWFVVALVLVGLGYLGSTGALADIANLILGSAPLRTPAVTPVP